MFKLTQQETPEICIMYIECYCAKKISFMGDTCPIVCPHCGELLPDALCIHKSNKERVVYHLDKETWA